MARGDGKLRAIEEVRGAASVDVRSGRRGGVRTETIEHYFLVVVELYRKPVPPAKPAAGRIVEEFMIHPGEPLQRHSLPVPFQLAAGGQARKRNVRRLLAVDHYRLLRPQIQRESEAIADRLQLLLGRP